MTNLCIVPQTDRRKRNYCSTVLVGSELHSFYRYFVIRKRNSAFYSVTSKAEEWKCDWHSGFYLTHSNIEKVQESTVIKLFEAMAYCLLT